MMVREPGGGAVGLVVAGMGAVGSSLLAGIEAARHHLAHPFGSLCETGGATQGTGAKPLRSLAALAELSDLRLGAFDLRDDDAYRAALRAGLFPRGILEELKKPLRGVRAMAGARQAPSRLHLAETLADDLRGFALHHGCSRGVLVCTVPGPKTHSLRILRNAGEVERALHESWDEVTPGIVYAAAAALAGFAFVAAAPDASLAMPGLSDSLAQAGVPIAGCGLLGPDAALREVLARMAAQEGLALTGTTSVGIPSGRSGQGSPAWPGAGRAQELALASTWAGGLLELSVEVRGPLELHLAARALDAALLSDLALRAGKSGAQGWMGALFSVPLGQAKGESSLAVRREAMVAALAELDGAARGAIQAA